MRNITFSSAGIQNHRRDRRLSMLRLNLEADGIEYNSCDWGLGGIRVEGLIPDRKLDESLPIKGSGVRKEQYLFIEVMATIVRINEAEAETALRFDDLTAEDLDTLEALITGRRITA
ncbi:MAG: hypothetical protein HOK21_02890 [Rhodospirillaceae bacterium]|nr:hypothetical protein [Rhodospirillaceae bacterium]MBT4042518.1 hypothetical protein [Rhodospirillaceae bacterium]MBT5083801.1 hypothetical protein [Rhodospirillaceae bacterium]MBT5523008.1 hypothetical protein [Rhodospirillaceae bacterium]MBT5880265.1 hypothetical protein [Rhodospirillaceae bacterium]